METIKLILFTTAFVGCVATLVLAVRAEKPHEVKVRPILIGIALACAAIVGVITAGIVGAIVGIITAGMVGTM